MLNNSIDFSKITYVSSKSRLTVRSKKKLDELAAQVALWNKDSFNRKRLISSEKKKMSVSAIRSKFNGDPVDRPVNTPRSSISSKESPTTSKPQSDKIMLANLRSVKKNAAFFENLATPQTKSLKKSNFTPRMKINTGLPFSPLSNIINADIAQVKSESKKFSTQDKNSGAKQYDNLLLEAEYQGNMESLKSRIEYDNNVDKENMFAESDNECPMPPPPPLSHTSSIESLTSEDSEDLTNVSPVQKSSTMQADIVEDSTFNKSLSQLEDIYNVLKGIHNYESDSESVDIAVDSPLKDEAPKNVRRSLSWNQNVSYIEPESDDISSAILSEDTISTENVCTSEHSDNTSIDELSRIESMDTNDVLSGTNSEFDINSSLNGSLLSYVEFDSIKNKDCATTQLNMDKSKTDLLDAINEQKKALGELNNMFMDPEARLGSERHTNIALRLVENTLRRLSLLEGSKCRPVGIAGSLEMKSIKLGIKEGYVVIDYNALSLSKRAKDLASLKDVHHVVMLARCPGDARIQKSQLFTIIPKSEALRLCLQHDNVQRLDIFEYVRFNKLRPEFKCNFEVYCMSLPSQKVSKASKKFTPIKKLFGLTPSRGEARVVDVRALMLFTNIGSFVVNATGMGTKAQRNGVNLRLGAGVPLTGEVAFNARFTMGLVEGPCKGRLNVYCDVGEGGSWAYYDCEVMQSSLCGWKVTEAYRARPDARRTEQPDLELPFHLTSGKAGLCSYQVCAKPNTFSVCLAKDAVVRGSGVSTIPFNRRMSCDGQRKTRFLAEAPSSEDAALWCDTFNEVKDSFERWARTIDG